METIIVSIMSLALIVVGGMTMSQGFLASVDSSATGLNRITLAQEEMMRTNIGIISVTQPSANQVKVIMRNSGQTKLASFSKWDVIVQYYDSTGDFHTEWLPYTTDAVLENNEWKVTGIYTDAAEQNAEAIEPGILNSTEYVVFLMKLINPVGSSTTNQVTISTPNGITVSAIFLRGL